MRPGDGSSSPESSPARRALGYGMLAVVVVLALAALGYVPTRRLGGVEAIPALWAGCLVSLLASMAGALPFFVARGKEMSPHGRLNRILGAMAVRLAVVLLLGAAVALSGFFALRPLLLWIAGSYMALLAVETLMALREMR